MAKQFKLPDLPDLPDEFNALPDLPPLPEGIGRFSQPMSELGVKEGGELFQIPPGVDPRTIIGTASLSEANVPTVEEKYRAIPQTSVTDESPETTRRREGAYQFSEQFPLKTAIKAIGEPVTQGIRTVGKGIEEQGRIRSGQGGSAARAAADIALGTTGAMISSIPAMMGINAITSQARPIISESVSKLGGNENQVELANKIFDYALAAKAFGVPIVAGMGIGELFGKLAEAGVNSVEDWEKMPDEDKQRIIELAHNVGFFAGAGAGAKGKQILENKRSEAIAEKAATDRNERNILETEERLAERAEEPVVIPESQLPKIESQPATEAGIIRTEQMSEAQRQAQGILTKQQRQRIPFESRKSSLVDPQGRQLENIPEPTPLREELRNVAPDYAKEAERLDVRVEKPQPVQGGEPLPMFTDNKTGSTFILGRGETLADAVERVRKPFEQPQMTYKQSLAQKEGKPIEGLQTKPEVPEITEPVLKEELPPSVVAKVDKAITQTGSDVKVTTPEGEVLSKAETEKAITDWKKDNGREKSPEAQALIKTLGEAPKAEIAKQPSGLKSFADSQPNAESFVNEVSKRATPKQLHTELEKLGYKGTGFDLTDRLKKYYEDVEQPSVPKPSTGKEALAEKQPWEMTKEEWVDEREKVKSETFGSAPGKASISKEVGKISRVEELLYGVNESAKQKIKDAVAGKIKLSEKEAAELQDQLDTPVTHRRVIEKALSEGKPVPKEVLADYPNLQKGKGEEPLPNESYIEAQRQIGGKYKLFYRGTQNEIFPNELFNSAQEARNYFKAQKTKEGGKLRELGTAALAYGGANVLIDQSGLDDDTKKKLKGALTALTIAGLGSVLMSKQAQSLLADIRSGVMKKALGEKWTGEKLASEIRKETESFLKSDEAKAFQPKDIEAIRRANNVGEFNKEVQNVAKEVATTVGANPLQIEPTNRSQIPNPVKVKAFKEVLKKINTPITNLREKFEDEWVRVKKLQNIEGAKVTEEGNPAREKELMAGRMGYRTEKLSKEVNVIDKDILESSKQLDIPDVEFESTLNKYLQAKHAPERNAVHGDGAAGITDVEAKSFVDKIESSKEGAEYKRIAQRIIDLNKQGLETLKESQLISKELYDKLNKDYPNYVPLNRIFEADMNSNEFLSSAGLSVKSSGLKRAKGSDRPIENIIQSTVENIAKFNIRAEKNLVDLQTLEFARNNPEMGLFNEIKVKPIATKADGTLVYPQMNNPNVLQLRENGKPVFLEIKDQQMARALTGINKENLPDLFRYVGAFTRLYSGLQTRFNPEFAIPNKIRDLQDLLIMSAAKKELGFGGAAKAALKDISSQRAVFDYVRGKRNPLSEQYEEMVSYGGTTGGMSLSTKSDVNVTLEQIKKVNRSQPRKIARDAIELIDKANEIVENSTRFDVYRQGIEQGLNKKDAAYLAKNATINFNRKGTGGAIVNSIYMFSNASIQGSANILRAMRNPKVAGAVVTTVGASVYAVNSYNDNIDPDWRGKISKYDRLNSLTVVLPSSEGFKYVSIPVAWGIKPIKAMADVSYDVSTGKEVNARDVFNSTVTSVLESYNPVGGTDIASALTPTILDVPIEIARNKSWTGGMIKPPDFGKKPTSELYFKDFGKTIPEKVSKMTTEKLSELGIIEVSPADVTYAYNQYVGGSGRFLSKILNVSTSLSSGEQPKARDIPFSSRFYKSISNEELSERMGFGESPAEKEIKSLMRSLQPALN